MRSNEFIRIPTDLLQPNGSQLIVQRLFPTRIQSLHKFHESCLIVHTVVVPNWKQHCRSEKQESTNKKYLDKEQAPQEQAFVQLVAN